MKRFAIYLVCFFSVSFNLFPQSELFKTAESNLTLTSYLDCYYVRDLSNDNDTINLVRFAGNSKFIDEFRVNIISFGLNYSSKDVQAVLDIQFGDIPHLLAKADESYVKFINKAFLGYRLYKDIWLQIGFLPDPVGSESSRPVKNLISTTTLSGYYEPDNFIGFKLLLPISDKLSSMIYGGNPFTLSRGKNKNFNAGIALTYIALENLEFDYTNLFGNQAVIDDSVGQYQLYNNFVISYSPIPILKLIGQFDYAVQKGVFHDKDRTESLISGFLTAKAEIIKNFSVSARYEYFKDDSGFMTGNLISRGGYLGTPEWKGYGMELSGYTFGVEYKPTANSYARLEYKYLSTKPGQHVFYDNTKTSRGLITLNTGITF